MTKTSLNELIKYLNLKLFMRNFIESIWSIVVIVIWNEDRKLTSLYLIPEFRYSNGSKNLSIFQIYLQNIKT